MKTGIGAAFLYLLLLSAACSQPSQPGAGESAETEETVEARPIRVTIDEDLPTLDPHHHLTIVGTVVLKNIFEPLVALDRESELAPSLAERWESSDSRTWKFFLRPEVTFHDGSALTVEDVVFSLKRAQQDPRSEVSGFLSAVSSVSGDAAEGRIDIETRRPDPTFLESLAHILIVPRAAPEEITDPIGTGPYRFVSYERGDAVKLQGFRDYWQGAPAETMAEFFIVPDPEEAVRLLAAGEIDLVRNLPPRLVDEVEGNADLWVESRLSQSVLYLQLNPGFPPLDDPNIRRAIDLAVDRQELMESVTLNHSRPASQMLGPDIFGHDSELEPTAHDLEAARELISKSKADKPAPLILETTDAYLDHGKAVGAQLAKAGIETDVISRPWPELYADLEDSKVGAWLGVWSFDGSDAAVFFDVVVHSPTEDGLLGGANFTKARSEELDRMIRNAGDELDPAAREAKLQEISRRETENRILIPLLWPLDLYGTRRDLEWEARKDGTLQIFEIRRR